MLNSVTLLGSSSGRNAGDAALIDGIMDCVDTSCGKQLLYEIPTIKPSYINNNYHQRVLPISMLPWNLSLKMLGLPTYRSIMRTDISLVFDAILFDRSLYNPLFNFMSTLALILPRAKKNGKKMAFFNVGTGPVDTPTGRSMLRDLADMMDFITVRDKDSLDILKDIGVKNKRVLLTADAALNVLSSNKERVDDLIKSAGIKDPEEEILGINVNAYIDTWARPKRPSMGEEAFVSVFSKALNTALQELKVPLLFISTQHHDVDITKKVMRKISSTNPIGLISNTTCNHRDIKGVLSRLSMLCAMRLHAMILATSELVPTVGIAYQPKCEYYFRSLDLDDYMLTFSNFTVNSLTDHILRGWTERKTITSRLNSNIPILKQEALKAGKLVAAISRGENLDNTFLKFQNGVSANAVDNSSKASLIY
jgi:polysaccharide pyruvyl transferase WcaK-like protein